MTKITRHMRAAYDRLVDAYASRNDAMPDALIPLAHRFMRGVVPNGHVLDVGCGTGRDMAWFENRGITVTGIDLSMAMLQFARHRVAGNLLNMDMCLLGLRDACFDGVWCCASLLHVPKSMALGALQGFRRVLKPGGMLAVVVQEGAGEAWEDSYVDGVSRFFARYRADELERILGRAGFGTIETEVCPGRKRTWLSCTCTPA